jgi:hypothetical protein
VNDGYVSDCWLSVTVVNNRIAAASLSETASRKPGGGSHALDPKVIEHLNTQMPNELTAVNQYFLDACKRLIALGRHEIGERE